MLRLTALAVLAASIVGCGSYSSYVDSESAALGRVVVYRNGIAYFERRAKVNGDQLSMSVPRDKVDDFLKSLTVRDARTGKAFPVSFPTRAANTDGTVDMVIQLPRSGDHDLVLSYITESPAWKPSYRLVVNKEGKVNVQGWAIVDNVSGEDWQQVRLGVGSSSALSFRYDLRTVRNVHRETLHTRERFAKAPPRGGAVHTDTATRQVAIVGSLSDKDIPRPSGHPDVAEVTLAKEEAPVAAGDMDAEDSSLGRGGRGRYRARVARRGSKTGGRRHTVAKTTARPAKPKPAMFGNDRRVRQLASTLKKTDGNVVIQGYSRRGERDAKNKSLDRANLLRNRLIAEGVAPARLQVNGNGWVKGHASGVQLVRTEDQSNKAKSTGADDNGDPVGESHFEGSNTVTVKRGTSAMVSILDGKAKGEVVYLYDAEANRGNSKFAFKAVRFKNPTDSTLESGPVTVYGNNRFIGEGLSQPIPPGATAFVPFALDRQVVVNRKGSTGDRIHRLLTISRGVLRAEVKHDKRTKLTLTNRQGRPVTVYVRHTVRKGWELTKSPKVFEKLGEAHLFEVALGARETKILQVVESTPLTRTVDLRTSTGLDLISVYLRTPHDDKRFEEPMRKLLTLHKDMANIREQILNTRERMEDFRERIDEIHAQIVNLQGIKGGGARLMRHLKAKMIEISNRLQSSTIGVVELQQKLMLAKIRFQDGVAELTLKEKPTTASADDVAPSS